MIKHTPSLLSFRYRLRLDALQLSSLVPVFSTDKHDALDVNFGLICSILLRISVRGEDSNTTSSGGQF